MKKNLVEDFKNSAKGVLRDKKKFIPFFLVAFIVEALFFSLFMMGHSVNEFYEYTISQKYDYHYIVEGLSDNNYSSLITRMMTLKPENKRDVEAIKHEIYKLGTESYHRLYVTLKDTKTSTVDSFIADVRGNTGFRGDKDKDSDDYYNFSGSKTIPYTYSPTPLMQLPQYVSDNNMLIGMLWFAIAEVTIFLLVSVYNVRISHYRFMYGVYMTCGAGFKKLVVGALFEMFVVFGIMIPPSFICSCIFVNRLFSDGSMPLIYISGALILALLSVLLVVCVAVVFPMRKISESMPIELITKGGTAEYVISPRRSANFLTKKFPVFYEMLSVKRFIKYYISLLVMCIVFNSLFVVGIYSGQLAETVRNTKTGAFTVTAKNITDDMMSEIVAIEGVEYATWEVSDSAGTNLHMLEMDKNDSSRAGAYTVENPTGKNVTIDFDIEGYSNLKLTTLSNRKLINVEGDISKLYLNDGVYRAVITRDIADFDTYDFEVGDKVTICVINEDPTKPITFNFNHMMTKIDITDELIKAEAAGKVEYLRYELEICAIIDYAEPLQKLRLGISPDMYNTVIGADSYKITEVEIFTPDNATDSADNKVYNNISRIICSAKDWNVLRTYSSYALNLASSTYVMGMFMTIAVLILTGAPVLWLFSQKVFYEKREDEVTLLYRMGAGEKRLLGMFFTGGSLVSVIAFVMSMLLSYVTSVGLLAIAKALLPFFGFKYAWMLTYEFELWTLLLSAAVCTVCGFVSSLRAYYRGKRDRHKKELEYLKDKRIGDDYK